jgi:hypothetical protein
MQQVQHRGRRRIQRHVSHHVPRLQRPPYQVVVLAEAHRCQPRAAYASHTHTSGEVRAGGGGEEDRLVGRVSA